jgi:hypothetical protein
MAQSSGEAGSGSSNADPPGPSYTPTEGALPHPPTEVASPHPPGGGASPYPRTEGAPPHPPTGRTVSSEGTADIVRQGPGVPVSSPAGRAGSPAGQAGSTAGQVWRTGQLPAPPRRRRRLRRAASSGLTVILLAAAAVVLFLRFHHAPLQVTGVSIAGEVTRGCTVDVTGRLSTNGSAGTVSYQWLFQPQSGAPQPLSQSVTAGQDAVYVTVTLDGQSHGSAAREVTLQVLGPGTGTASVHVVVSC